jgi:hypothetical protein
VARPLTHRAQALCLALAVAACGGSAAARTPACVGTPDPGYRLLFDGTRASFAKWAHAGPGRFALQDDCTLATSGGLGLLWYDDEAFDSPMTLKVEWMIRGDANSGVFVGFPAIGNDPFVAVNRGYEIQIDPTDNPDATTGAIYGFRAADAALRDRALRPPGEWNTYEITVDAPRIVVRLNGVVVNRFVSTSAARASLGHSYVGLQNHSDADRVSFRSVQVKEWRNARPRCAGGTTTRAPSDAFSGTRLDGCRWNRIVRYDGGALHMSGGALHLELTGDEPSANLVLQRAPVRTWTIETTVRVPLRSGSEQAGLIAYHDDRNYVTLVAAAASGGKVRFRLATGPATIAPRPRNDTYTLRLSRRASRYTAWWKTSGTSWRRLGSVDNTRLGARAAFGLVARGQGGIGAPPYAAFQRFRVS